jgi:Domain of unknown function (DUF4440)
MKNFLFVFLFAISNIAFAQPEKEVETAAEKLRLAIIDPTQDALQRLTSKNLSYGHSSGMIENQTAFIEALVSGKSDFKTISVSDQSVVLSGKNVAVVRHKLKGELVAAGGAINTVNLGILLVWTKEKGEWKLLARQAFRL